MPPRDLFRNDADLYLSRLQAALSSRSVVPTRVWERLFADLLSVTGAPPPDSRIVRCFMHPTVLRELSVSLLMSDVKLREALDALRPVHQERGKATTYRVRELGVAGSYPNCDVAANRSWYTVHRGVPYLVTLNSAREELRWSYGSELSDWTRQETKLAAAISCVEWGGFVLYLGGYGHDFLVTLLDHVEREDYQRFMIEYVLLSEHRRHVSRPSRRTAVQHGDAYGFADFRSFQKKAKAFAAGFLVSHQILLRTARNYVKAAMLARTDGFHDDAITSLFYALEGCLLMFQEIEGRSTTRIDRKLLRAVFTKLYRDGESVFDFVEEAMGWGGTRAQLVHPQLAESSGWVPSLYADDWYEYDRVVRALLTYLVTGQTFEDYELAS